MFRRLSHVCLITHQLERQIAYYRDKLGFTVQFRFHDERAGGEFGAYLACGDTTFIEIFDQKGAAAVWGGDTSPLTRGNQYSHFCLEVTGLEDLCDLLEGRGLTVSPIKTGIDYSAQAWLTDPDGNRIELMEFTHRSKQLQPAEG